MIRIGSLGSRSTALVDERGALFCEALGWSLDWWIGADDRWRVPARENSVRQSRLADGPVVRTAVRVPSGDAVQTAYAARAPHELVIWEIENDSPAAFVVALVIKGARAVNAAENIIFIDRRWGITTTRPASRWSVGRAEEVDVEVCGGTARTGPFPPTADRAGRITGAFLFPVAHRTRLRFAISLSGSERSAPDIDLATLPDADAVARGWDAHLARGLRVELPDAQIMSALRSAQAEALLTASRNRPAPDLVAGLEDWGFDAEAATAWARLTTRARRRYRPDLSGATWESLSTNPGDLLRQIRNLLVAENSDEPKIEVLRHYPSSWRGQGVEVHNAPTLWGSVSFAVRWHGDRPALFWDIPVGVELSVPGLDADFVTREPKGEMLLAANRT